MSKPIKPARLKDNGQAPSFLEELQNSLIRRFSKSPKKPEPIMYEFTDDRALLHQYYRLREDMYRSAFATDKFNGQEDAHDKISEILVARRGKLCIGGCRVTVREADEMFGLPMESENFKLRELLPELNLDKLGHCEISRFAILAEDESKLESMYVLSKLVRDKAISYGLGYILMKSTYPLARNWRMIARKLDVKNTEICKDIHPPAEHDLNPDVKRYLVVSDITSFSQANAKVELPSQSQPVTMPAKPHMTIVD